MNKITAYFICNDNFQKDIKKQKKKKQLFESMLLLMLLFLLVQFFKVYFTYHDVLSKYLNKSLL